MQINFHSLFFILFTKGADILAMTIQYLTEVSMYPVNVSTPHIFVNI